VTTLHTAWRLTGLSAYQIELVQWPPGHADGISVAELAQP
jgi:hypothetical protein